MMKNVQIMKTSSSSFLACTLRLCSAICQHHPPQRAVLSQICCFRERKVVLFQILLDSDEPHDACLLQSAAGEANRILLASVLSSMHIICPNKVSRCEWIIAVSLGCFVSRCTSSVPNKLVPFNGKQHTTLVKCIDLVCIRLRYRPAVRTMVRCTCCTASTSLRWRAVTSKSDFLSSVWQHE